MASDERGNPSDPDQSSARVPLASFLSAVTNDALQLILLPTEACNFRCLYCYEDFALGRMEDRVVQGVRALIARRAPTLRTLSLSWFGGEPLLAKRLVLDLQSFAWDLGREHPQLAVSGSMTTNGYTLDLATAEALVRVGINVFQISLDGPAAEHDRVRVRADGVGTFDRIWANLIALRRSSLPVNVLVRLHMTQSNLPTLRAFAAVLARELAPDPRFSFLFKPVEHLGGPNDAEISVLDHSEAADVIRELTRIVRPEAAGGETRGEKRAPYVCYAAKANSWVIRANGDVCKCTVGFEDPRNRVGKLTETGELVVDADRHARWLRGWELDEPALLSCPAHHEPRRASPRSLPVIS